MLRMLVISQAQYMESVKVTSLTNYALGLKEHVRIRR